MLEKQEGKRDETTSQAGNQTISGEALVWWINSYRFASKANMESRKASLKTPMIVKISFASTAQ